MCKKLVIAGVAILVGLALVSGTKVGSHLRLKWKRASAWAERQVTPETEIQRLRMEVDRLEKQDAVYLHKVAEQRVELREREAKVKEEKTDAGKLEAVIVEWRQAIHEAKQSNRSVVSVKGQELTLKAAEERVLRLFTRFEPLEASIKSQEAGLETLRTALSQNEKKHSEAKRTRENMRTQLQDLENALAEMKAKEQENGRGAVLDDSGYAKVQADIAALRRRLAIEKEKQHLLTSDKEAAERADEENARKQKEQAALDARFPVAGNAPPKN